MKKILLLTITIIFLVNHNKLNAQNHGQDNIDYQLRTKWINSTIESLKEFDKSMVEKKVVLKTRDKNGLIHQSYRINKSGLIEFGEKEWVYIVLHSSHHKDMIGDVAIAINQKGETYIHLGHNCGMIAHYEAESSILYSKSDDFFEHFKSDVDKLPWEKHE